MLKKLWLTFAQAVAIGLALVFVVATLRPEWLPERLAQPAPPPAAPMREAPAADAPKSAPAASILSYAEAARRATPTVVNVFTTKESRVAPDNPFFNDPMFR